ncbi:exopolysaccharide biosynthesis glycosyltransferase EpsD [Armatimonas rosea]|uniref:Glycosyltransferase involved in cell wall biosynthesis n=1 Tax=Armatimonas rosea TaxID=685828 RepID=A0A7W9SSV0_ARMRO|nr:exopolysaccharide biosynthesis glycosyltransferase EpsD [Armatimonas rosea]MBB6051638.1 glycosyltransferase involved in cell wall biosynthesis [Armatimonas rosea]
MPFLSVVIPTYNRCESLRVTLEALKRQEPVTGGFEVVVVSDGSTDGTDALLVGWLAARLPFTLRVIRQENAGPARARNRGVQEATGEVIVFLDDDVEPQMGCLQVHAQRHLAEKDLVLIGPMSPDPERRRVEPVWIAWEHAMLQKQYSSWKSGTWAAHECGPHNFYTGNASVRRAFILAVGGFDEGFTRQEDVELATRMERTCGVYFRFEPAAAAFHRPHRSFESWLRVPYAYGKLDVIRAQRGDASWEVVRHGYASRQKATRLLADLALPRTGVGEALRGLLRIGAEAVYALPLGGARRAGLGALSALYNLHYLEGARDELGSWDALHQVLRASTTSAYGDSKTEVKERAA